MKHYSAYHRAIYQSPFMQDSLNIVISPTREPFLRYPGISRILPLPSLDPRSDLSTQAEDLFPDRILDNLPNRLLLSRSLFEIFPKTKQSNALSVGLIQSQPPRLLWILVNPGGD